MAIRTTNSAETWEKIYEAFKNVSFVSFDFDTIKASIIQYVQRYYSEQFNDFVSSSEMLAIIDAFAYIAEQMAYRIDMVGHENFINTAQRKASILRLARLVSYKPSRNIPHRGLVKATSISTTERVIDSAGRNLAGTPILWNDSSNQSWREQWNLVLNRVLSSRVGNPSKSFQLGDVQMDLYSFNNSADSFKNGVSPFTADAGLNTWPMEVVPADIDENGPFEREPDQVSGMGVIIAEDGIGDAGPYTGLLMYVKQGVLTKVDYTIENEQPNRRLEFSQTGVNHNDVWVQQLSSSGNVATRWQQVETVAEQNLVFSSNSEPNRYEVETLENDRVAILFGDGDFSAVPVGDFRFWLRQSSGSSSSIPSTSIVNVPLTFTYVDSSGITQTAAIAFSLISDLLNASASETIEHIRQSAPTTYYSQNRMVNGEDYNTYMLKDQSIARLKVINRTFAGSPRYLDAADSSGSYQNVKIFGDDAIIRTVPKLNTVSTAVSGQALIDSIIEPLLIHPGALGAITHIRNITDGLRGVVASARRAFIEDASFASWKDSSGTPVTLVTGLTPGIMLEKTAIQAFIDRHWYGEPTSYVQQTDGSIWAVIPNPTIYPEDDGRIYASAVPRTIDGVNKYPPGDVGSGLQPIVNQQHFMLQWEPKLRAAGNGILTLALSTLPSGAVAGEVFTVEILGDSASFAVRSSLRGAFPSGVVGTAYSETGAPSFTITVGSLPFYPGDAFILDCGTSVTQRQISWATSSISPINIRGYWKLSPTTANTYSNLAAESWSANDGLIYVKAITSTSGITTGYEVTWRELELQLESPTTRFWFNSTTPVVDKTTSQRVYDNIKLLRSNIDSAGTRLTTSKIYDIVGVVKDGDGIIDTTKIVLSPSDYLQTDSSGDLQPDNALEWELFSSSGSGSWEFATVVDPSTIITPSSIILSVTNVDEASILVNGTLYHFPVGSSIDDSATYVRRARMPRIGGDSGLDFMWQHFAPDSNLIDPATTNIHDAYVITNGYFNAMMSYAQGYSSKPSTPSALDLRTSYGYLLKNKMLSDTVVMQSGTLRLLFGPLAEPQLRAKFKIVRGQSPTLTDEQVKVEVLNVINDFFAIENWDFGDTFFATELFTAIHIRLGSEISSVVLVPLFSSNSFGSLFTVESGENEIWMSAAQLSDIEVVTSLTSTVLRQK